MSLIADALKEAARERPTARAVRPTKPLGQIVVPSPRRSRGRRRMFATIGVVAATGLAVAIGAYAYLRFPNQFPGRFATRPPTPVLPTAPTIDVASPIVLPPVRAANGAINVAPPKTAAVTAKPRAGDAATVSANPVSTPTSPANVVQQGAPRVSLPAPTPNQPAVTPTAVKPTAVKQTPIPATPAPIQPATPSLAPKPAAAAPRTADSLFKRAYEAHTRGDLDAAADLYQRAIATETAPASVFNDYGVLLEQRGDHAGAARMFRQAIGHDDTNVDAWVNLGDALDARNEHGDALSAFARASQLDPSRIAVKTRLAAQYQALGDMTTARQFFEDAVRLDPKEPSSHYALGLFLQSQHDLAGAIREFGRFVDLAGEKYPPNTIADVKTHILALRKLTT